MAIAIVGSLILGAFLGQFYKFFVLIPVILLIFAAELAGAVYCGCGLLRPLSSFALMATSLQIGYVAIPVCETALDLLRGLKLPRRGRGHQLLRGGSAQPPKKLLSE